MKKFDYDIIVIGSGVAGRTAALMSASAGKKVAIVEAGNWGGSNASYDVPYAAASTMSRAYHGAVEGAKFGISSGNLKYNYPSVLNWIETARARSGAASVDDLQEAGVTCLSGFAQFISANEIAVGETGKISAAKFLIATGTAPSVSGITGVSFEEDAPVRCLLPSEVFSLQRLPKVVMVVGAGATGCEMAEYFAEMGAKVLLSEISERVLPKEDPEAGEVIEKRLNELDVKVLTGSRVLAVADGGEQALPTGRKIHAAKVSFIRGGQEKSVRVEAVVLATGSAPMVDMGLKNTGVKFSTKGISVNGQMQTNVKNIYAAGDVAEVKLDKKAETPNISSTERAAYEGAVAAMAMLGKGRTMADYRGFIRMTNTYPSVACLGLTEDECIVRDKKCDQILIPLGMTTGASITDAPDGFVKILTAKERSGTKLIGATIVAPDAAALAQELAIAMRSDISLVDLAAMPHVSGSLSEAIKIAAKSLVK